MGAYETMSNIVVERAISKFNELSFERQIEFFMKNADIFRYIFSIFNEEKNSSQSDADFNIFALRNMIEYIYINFSYSISLDGIAKVGNVSTSKCLRIFKL